MTIHTVPIFSNRHGLYTQFASVLPHHLREMLRQTPRRQIFFRNPETELCKAKLFLRIVKRGSARFSRVAEPPVFCASLCFRHPDIIPALHLIAYPAPDSARRRFPLSCFESSVSPAGDRCGPFCFLQSDPETPLPRSACRTPHTHRQDRVHPRA